MVRKRRIATDQRLPDVERSMVLDFRLLFFDMTDVAEMGSAAQVAGEFGQSLKGASGVDLDASIGKVKGIPGKVQTVRSFLGEVTVSDALDTAGYVPAPG